MFLIQAAEIETKRNGLHHRKTDKKNWFQNWRKLMKEHLCRGKVKFVDQTEV